jgi:prepilin-type processing-associated H-X9-DG protein
MELLVSITIISILASLLMPSLRSAQDSTVRIDINAKVRSMIQIVGRFSRIKLADYAFRTIPTSDNVSYSFFVGPNANLETINTSDYWVSVELNDYPELESFKAIDPVHPLNPTKGYFGYFGNFFNLEMSGTFRSNWFISTRKIAMDIYDYQHEGDGKISIGFADGHVEAQTTNLKGIDDDIGTLIVSTMHSTGDHVESVK